MIYEVCIDSVEGAVAAQAGGAQRVELCANLVEGGTTPSIGTIRLARQRITIGLNVILRPRGGDFVFSDTEFAVTRTDLLAAKEAGADAVVIGLLLPDGTVDRARTAELVALARPMQVTFHRAIDLCRDSAEALETLVDLGVDRILTSGRKATVIEGADCIAALVRQSAGRIVVMAGGGVTAANLPGLIARTGIQEAHFSARETIQSPMTFRSRDCFMGKAYEPDEYIYKMTTAALVRKVVEAGNAA
jgi:copper homeostasis protein